MSDRAQPRQQFLFWGVLLAAGGLYFVSGDDDFGWVFLILGGMLLFAGLIGAAVNPGPGERAPNHRPKRPWHDR
jgi:hypothetical protein